MQETSQDLNQIGLYASMQAGILIDEGYQPTGAN